MRLHTDTDIIRPLYAEASARERGSVRTDSRCIAARWYVALQAEVLAGRIEGVGIDARQARRARRPQ